MPVEVALTSGQVTSWGPSIGEIPEEELESVAKERDVWNPSLYDLILDKWKKMDGWMETRRWGQHKSRAKSSTEDTVMWSSRAKNVLIEREPNLLKLKYCDYRCSVQGGCWQTSNLTDVVNPLNLQSEEGRTRSQKIKGERSPGRSPQRRSLFSIPDRWQVHPPPAGGIRTSCNVDVGTDSESDSPGRLTRELW
ncbi:unnamed protein product [Pleuronectes platessa]|uniref:Uncharacterized protein n=1 Tax=Pleuronectes platessa TaxID=8262 RepID=A0A9N7VL49_PLEPL|nr:unnamed protein product [Pleuronectes platessa]